MMLYAVHTGELQPLPTPAPGAILMVHQYWSPDSKSIAGSTLGVGEGLTVWVTDIASRASRVVLDMPSRNYNYGAGCIWSPLDTCLVFGAWQGEAGHERFSIFRVSPEGKALEEVLTSKEPLTDLTWSPDGHRVAYIRDKTLCIIGDDMPSAVGRVVPADGRAGSGE